MFTCKLGKNEKHYHVTIDEYNNNVYMHIYLHWIYFHSQSKYVPNLFLILVIQTKFAVIPRDEIRYFLLFNLKECYLLFTAGKFLFKLFYFNLNFYG